ncbi:hypothetical protein PN499_18100 [Kamptonema animale CS-326]|jgi:hypothetical protein|uniref:hypothetical protein n=1 Tax=Kamptonema animale TaxID=92934 RepID=UPI0023314AE7|nr:hypothetical protein [Kamptonema animale]MDB9513108.1 hypothetical protein [Kamptonema animale CS-326]
MKSQKCYACERTATTRDHIPPKCFFPEKKYLPSNSSDYRSNLITVPSCSEHNNFRSRDDEYAAAVIVMNSKSDLAFTIFKSKWVQTLLRREAVLGKRIFSTARNARVISINNGLLIPYDTLAITYEVERIERVIESIARALYYHDSGYQEKWVNSCIIKSLNFLKRDLNPPEDAEYFTRINQYFIDPELGLTKKGSHPDVFYYQFFQSKERNSIIRIVFYGYFTFLAFLQEKEIAPSPIIFAI